MIQRILTFVQRLALTFWLGEMLFFILIFAPRVFVVLARPDAARLQASIFPAYFLGGVIAGALFILMSLALYAMKGSHKWGYRLILPLALVAWAIFIYSRWWITPEIAQLHPLLYQSVPDPSARALFDHLHHLSVQLNGAALLALLAILFLL